MAAFTLRALRKTFFDEPYRQKHLIDDDPGVQSDIDGRISVPEKFGASLLIWSTLVVGLYPKFLLDRIVPAVEAMRFLQP